MARPIGYLTRPEGRMRLRARPQARRSAVCFNPHPTRRPDATPTGGDNPSHDPAFQSSPDPKAGCDLGVMTLPPNAERFNPHPTRRPDATRRWRASTSSGPPFQSSPDPKAGCDQQGAAQDGTTPEFQSSPDPKAGCDAQVAGKHVVRPAVSILTRPEGRMRPAGCGAGRNDSRVSILTRPEGRMRLSVTCLAARRRYCCFNPHPTRRPDATRPILVRMVRAMGFNPHPTRRPDATRPIITRVVAPGFQSSPDPKAGCDSTYTGANGAGNGFQSSPDPKAGCDPANHHQGGRAGVSILTRPEGRMRPFTVYTPQGSKMFQSSPDPKAGCDAGAGAPVVRLLQVSILTRPEGRMRQVYDVSTDNPVTVFQSSPDPKAGCDPIAMVARPPTPRSFNPHPTRRPDATSDAPDSISWTYSPVSILTRPEGRMRPSRYAMYDTGGLGFQSSPDPKAGCDLQARRNQLAARKFQSSPDPKAGCDIQSSPFHHARRVSILTRPEGRMRLPDLLPGHTRLSKFQSSPDPKAGCDDPSRHGATTSPCFNPHPTRRPDATISRAEDTYSGTIAFQSSPDPKAGCDTWWCFGQPLPTAWFQSSPDPKAGCDW